MHCGKKLLVGVISDAGRLVRRDIGRIQRAKGLHNGKSAGIGFAAFCGVAYQAIRGFREVLALLDQ